MKQYNIKPVHFEPLTKYTTQINHIWTNILMKQSHFGSTQTYSR
jgi:hypothetical protein